jgi:hypothetical protein
VNTETVTVLTAGTVTDPYSGEETESWEVAPTETDVTTLAPPEPRPSEEPVQDARNSIVDGWTLYLPLTTPAISAAQRVRVRGEVYPIQGQPAVWDDVGVVVQAFRTVG